MPTYETRSDFAPAVLCYVVTVKLRKFGPVGCGVCYTPLHAMLLGLTKHQRRVACHGNGHAIQEPRTIKLLTIAVNKHSIRSVEVHL